MASARSWNEVGTSLPERVGLLAAVGLSGLTFGRSLMPRTLLGQTVVTGLWGAASYGLVSTCESAVIATTNAAAARLDRRADDDGDLRAVRGQAFGYVAHAVAAGVGLAVERSLPHRPHDTLLRAAVRTSGVFVREAATAGALSLAVLDAVSRTGRVPRTDDHVGTAYRANTPWYGQLGALTAVGGVTAATTVYLQRRRAAALDRELGWTPTSFVQEAGPTDPDATGRTHESPGSSAALAAASGAATALAIVGFGKAEGLASRGVARLARPLLGRHGEYAPLIGKAVTLGALATGIVGAVSKLYHSVEHAGDAIEDAYRNPPTARTVSGGPGSMIPWSTLAREGRRFVNMVLTQAEISAVTGATAQSPVRAFVGLESAETPLARAVLAIDEMERLGAFERSVVCVASPTGTGYVNPTVAETMEYLTGGDCATVAVQYSLRPSFLSLDRVRVGRENNIALLTLLRRRLDQVPVGRRPRLVGVGESLGAHTLQDTALHRGVGGLAEQGIERALFIGTPAGSGWAREWRDDPVLVDPEGMAAEVASIEEWHALPAVVRDGTRYVLLTHHEDPIAKFGPGIMMRRPEWLDPDGPRDPGVPPEMTWRPFLTGFVTLADVGNAQNVTPGVFDAFGHDYRGDLARFTRLAFELPGDEALMDRVELALREREAAWATRRNAGVSLGSAVLPSERRVAG